MKFPLLILVSDFCCYGDLLGLQHRLERYSFITDGGLPFQRSECSTILKATVFHLDDLHACHLFRLKCWCFRTEPTTVPLLIVLFLRLGHKMGLYSNLLFICIEKIQCNWDEFCHLFVFICMYFKML